MALTIKLPEFNREIADAFIGASNSMTGLPESPG